MDLKKGEDHGNLGNWNKEQGIVTYWNNPIGNRSGSFTVQGRSWHEWRNHAKGVSISNYRHCIGRSWNRVNGIGILLFAAVPYYRFPEKPCSTEPEIRIRIRRFA